MLKNVRLGCPDKLPWRAWDENGENRQIIFLNVCLQVEILSSD